MLMMTMKPTSRMPTACPLAPCENWYSAAGPHTSGVPSTGRKAMKNATTPQNSGSGTANTHSVSPVRTPCTKATSTCPSTLACTLFFSASPSSCSVSLRKGR